MARTAAAVAENDAGTARAPARESSDDGVARETFMMEEGDSLVMDLSNVEERVFEQIPRGVYNAEVDNVEWGKSQNSGEWMFTFTFRFLEEKWAKTKRKWYASFSPKAVQGTKGSLNRFAKDIFGSGPFNPEEVANSGQLIGRPVRLKIGQQDYNGEKRDRIDAVLPAQEGSGNANSGGNRFL